MKIFVSSTFTDMDLARDIINKQVQPRLSHKLLEKYGIDVDFTDFRWGINTENTPNSAAKTMLTCLEAINEAAPPMPMLILLGDRCSRPLSPEILALAEKEFSFTVENKQCGITELEIEYGAMRDAAHQSRAIFCYISREDSKPEPAMQLLRQKIDARFPQSQILRFIYAENEIISEEEFLPFWRVVTDELWRRISVHQLLPDEATQEDVVHLSYMEKKAGSFRSRHKLFDRGMAELESGTPTLFITGETGAGKSSMLSRLLLVLKGGKKRCEVLPIFCGLTENMDTGMEVLQHIVAHLEKLLGKTRREPDTFDGWKDYEEQLCMEYESANLPRLVIGIDAVDQLRSGEIAQELLFLPLGVYKRVQFIVSFTPEIKVPRRFSGASLIRLDLITEEETREIIRGLLSEYNKRELAQSVEDRLVEYSRGKVPLYLNFAIQALKMMDITEFDPAHKVSSMEGINRAQLGIIDQLVKDAPCLLVLCRRFLSFACNRIDSRLYTSLVNIAAAPYGFTTEMLQALEPETFHAENFLLLRHYLKEVFILRADGRHDFAHKCFRQSLFFINENGRPDNPEHSQKIFGVLYALEEKHPVRVSDILHFAAQCKQYNYATDYILNAFANPELQHRRFSIRQLIKDHCFCRNIIENLETYLAREWRTQGFLKMVERLTLFTVIFGGLLARGNGEQREDIIKRQNIYFSFMLAIRKALDVVKKNLVRDQEDSNFSIPPCFEFLSGWFTCCERYQLLLEKGNQYNEGPSESFFGTIGDEKFDHPSLLSQEEINLCDAMDAAAFKKRFCSDPEETFRIFYFRWLEGVLHHRPFDFSRLFEQPELFEGCFIRVFQEARTKAFEKPGATLDDLDSLREYYEKVYARAMEGSCVMKSWQEFSDPIYARHGGKTEAGALKDPFVDFSQRYRDLEHKENSDKYVSFFQFAKKVILRLKDEQTEKAIACCNDAVAAAEKALRFTDGRNDFFEEFFAFNQMMRELFSALEPSVRIPAAERVYEHQFSFILHSDITAPVSAYAGLVELDYPAAMLQLYALAERTPTDHQKSQWYSRAFWAAIKVFEEAENDWGLRQARHTVGEYDDQFEMVEEKVYYDAQIFLLRIVSAAVEALYGMNGATKAGLEDSETTRDLYDSLEDSVWEVFGEGSEVYPKNPLKDRIDALRAENKFPLFTALLERIDEALTPPPPPPPPPQEPDYPPELYFNENF